MTDVLSDSQATLLHDLACEFTQSMRRGERPAIDDYAARHPQLAREIQDLFPTLQIIEQLGPTTHPDSVGSQVKLPAPRQLGEYEILREIGRGGMGIVYEAVQESLGRHVALKVLSWADRGNRIHLERFDREARTAAQLHHTNIVPVFGIGEDNGVHYYAMQFIAGQTLDAVLDAVRRGRHGSGSLSDSARRANKPELDETLSSPAGETDKPAEQGTAGDRPGTSGSPPPPRPKVEATIVAVELNIFGSSPAEYHRGVAKIGLQAAEALSFAHQQDVLHRDIKPGNLMLDVHGNLWITDFGLARTEGQDELTSPGDVVGTLRYTPPERFQGCTDARGDMYGLGLTLYELLALQPAFQAGSRVELIHRILNWTPPPLCGVDRGVPRDLATIVHKAMSREPAQRYQTARFMADDLRRFLSDRPILARPMSVPEHAWRWCRRNSVVATLTALAVVLLGFIAVQSLVASMRLEKQLHQTLTAERQGREKVFESLLAQGRALRISGKMGQRFEALKALREAATLSRELGMSAETRDDLRDEVIAALSLPDVEFVKTIPVNANVDFNPQLKRYAYGDSAGNVKVHRVADDKLLHELAGPISPIRTADFLGVYFSPDGRCLQHLGFGFDSRKGYLRLWDLTASRPRLVLDLRGGALWTSFSFDSRRLAVNVMELPPSGGVTESTRVWIRIYDTKTGQECAPPIPSTEFDRLAFHPGLAQLAISDASAVRIIDIATGAEIGRWQRPGVTWLAWRSDGKRILAACDPDVLIYRWDVTAKRALPPLKCHNSGGIRFVFDNSGDTLVTSAWSGVSRLWDPRSNRHLLDIDGLALTNNFRFSPNDEMCGGVWAHGCVNILRVEAGRELLQFDVNSEYDAGFPRAALSHDGRLLAASGGEGTYLIDIDRGEQLAIIPGARLPLVFDSAGMLLTYADAPEGLVRWPLDPDPNQPGRLAVGAQQPITCTVGATSHALHGVDTWGSSANGRVIAAPNYNLGAKLLVAEQGEAGNFATQYRQIELVPQVDVRFCAVSQDGEWVATGSHDPQGKVKLWDGETGNPVMDIADAGRPLFSSDGRWLAVANPVGDVRLWHVGSWAPASKIDRGPQFLAFDPESRLFAIEHGYGTLRLVVPETGRDIAQLSVPEKTRLKPECFSSDGARLVAFGLDNGQLYIWNLRRIREQLAELDMDWDRPVYESNPPQVHPPIEITIDEPGP